MDSEFLYYLHEIKEVLESVVAPVVLIILPAVVAAYYKVMKSLRNLKFTFGKGFDARLRDWETNFSRNVIQSIGFFIDGVDSNPYCRADQILYIGLENGVVGPCRIHSMYMSVHAENSGLSRCSKKACSVQRVPYTSLASWCTDIESSSIMKIPNLSKSMYATLSIHACAKSTIAAPVYTKERWLTGIVVFNYFDEDFNFQNNTTTDEELMESIKVFIKGQVLQMDIARMAWVRDQ